MPAAKTAPQTFPAHIALPVNDRRPVIESLNGRLAGTADLYSQVKQAHWNVKGSNFFQLHLSFDQLAAEVFPWVESRWEPREWPTSTTTGPPPACSPGFRGRRTSNCGSWKLTFSTS